MNAVGLKWKETLLHIYVWNYYISGLLPLKVLMEVNSI